MSVLDGVRVLEMAVYGLGPQAGNLLVGLGADVVKVEPPVGDPARHARWIAGVVNCELPDGSSAFFRALNRDKRSVVLDLKSAADRETFFHMAADADVLLHSYRPGALAKLGLGYEDLAKVNPRLIYAGASGFGTRGPDGGRGGLDYVGQARSGFMMTVGGDGEPPGYSISGVADMAGGLTLAFAIVTALLDRERTGRGSQIETSHLAAMLALQSWAVGVAGVAQPKTWPRLSREQPGSAMWNHYECRDGAWLALSIQEEEAAWPDVCAALGTEELRHERFATDESRRLNARELARVMGDAFLQRDRDEWLAVFERFPKILWERVQQISDLVRDPQVLANDYLIRASDGDFALTPPFSTPGVEPMPRGTAPGLGEHQAQLTSEGKAAADGDRNMHPIWRASRA